MFQSQDGGKKKQEKKADEIGSKRQVFNGSKKRTSGGLEKKDLMKNKRGLIVSKKASENGKKALERLIEKGFVTQKGVFGVFKKVGVDEEGADVLVKVEKGSVN